MAITYNAVIKNAAGATVWTKELKHYARYSVTASMHQRALDAAAQTLGAEAVTAEITLMKDGVAVIGTAFEFRNGVSRTVIKAAAK